MNEEVVTTMPLAIDGVGSCVLVILGQGIIYRAQIPPFFTIR